MINLFGTRHRRRQSSRGLAALLLALVLAPSAPAQMLRGPALPSDQFRAGKTTLEAFAPVTERARHAVVRIEIDGEPVALGTVVASDGLVVTKASEIVEGKLTARLVDGGNVDAILLARDDQNDMALLRIQASDLTPIEWAKQDIRIGQWAITPDTDARPASVGIVSVPPRKIIHRRALIGVMLDIPAPRIREIMPGYGAEKADLKAGDVILSVEGESINSAQELVTLLRGYREGQTVHLRARRGDDEFEAGVLMMPEENTRSRQHRIDLMGGDISRRADGFDAAIQHDTVLEPWQCGGPLLNLEGKAVGLNIARAGRVASYALPAGLVQQIVENLRAQEAVAVTHREEDDMR